MMLTISVALNVVLGVLVFALWSERQALPARDKSGRFKAKGKSKKQTPDFFKDLTGDTK